MGATRRAALLALPAALAAGTARGNDAPPPGAQFPQEEIRLPREPLRFPVERIATNASTNANEMRFRLGADILFDFDRADLRPHSAATLRDLLAQIRARFPRGAALRVEGHTDALGTDAYNDALSLQRAESVRRWFVQAGLAQNAIQAAGFGRRQPVAENRRPDGSDDPIGRQRNRRVEIVATAAPAARR